MISHPCSHPNAHSTHAQKASWTSPAGRCTTLVAHGGTLVMVPLPPLTPSLTICPSPPLHPPPEGIVDKPADLDVASVMAMGFPPYR